MPRHRMTALIGMVVLISTAFLGAAAAQALTRYPPGTSVPLCTPSNVNAGNLSVGQTVTFSLCGDFTGTANVTVNGVSVGTKTPTSDGAIKVVVTATSQTNLEIDDPTNVAAICGTNTVTATGPGNPGTSTGTFALLCKSTTSTTTSSGLAFTGANVALAVLIALVLIGLGVVLVLLQRRRRPTI